MRKTYNVLWIDDQFEDLQDFIINAEEGGILLDGYKSYEEGIEALEADLYRYDAVVVDARFFKGKEQGSGSEDLKGLAATTNDLIRLEQVRE